MKELHFFNIFYNEVNKPKNLFILFICHMAFALGLLRVIKNNKKKFIFFNDIDTRIDNACSLGCKISGKINF